ncbi:WS/DGAT/MGAT family O-acyltransferase [Tsukamurella soli]|uniref:Diacylglycerol O-acyltransferase n=1 Tax=Tsukamurella soli TaxID=644556 RepID=A0ABP8KB60_9ACTN
MKGRLSQADAEFFALEDSTTPTHIGSLAIFRKPAVGLDHDQLLNAVEERLATVPRYRQKVKQVPLGLGRPIWVDDRDFDITYHVRVSALPQPGSEDQLHDLVARLNSRPLDRERPLWEMYLIEGLADGRMAVFTKSHLALVNGRAGGLEIMQVLLTPTRRLPEPADDMWMGQHEPSDGELVVGAVVDLLSRPKRAVSMVQGVVGEVAESVGGLREAVTEVAVRAAGIVRSRAAAAPVRSLNVPISRSRRYAVVTMELAQFRKLRTAYGCTVNDLLLSVVAGGLRTWLISRGEPISQSTQVQALVPIAVDDGVPDQPQRQLQAYVVSLPVAEGNTVIRLRQIAHEAASQVDRNRQVAARALATAGGFPPSTMHALGTRTALSVPPRLFNILVTNAPGPQAPVYLAGNELLDMYPVPPLIANQVVTIGITSYNGKVYMGLNADRDGMWDVVSMTEFLYEALEELVEVAKS